MRSTKASLKLYLIASGYAPTRPGDAAFETQAAVTVPVIQARPSG